MMKLAPSPPLQEFVLKLAKPVQVTQIVVMCINGAK